VTSDCNVNDQVRGQSCCVLLSMILLACFALLIWHLLLLLLHAIFRKKLLCFATIMLIVMSAKLAFDCYKFCGYDFSPRELDMAVRTGKVLISDIEWTMREGCLSFVWLMREENNV
jgi:hypothetical protein